VSDHGRVERVFDVHASIPLAKGLAATAIWARALEIAPLKRFDRLEVTAAPTRRS
jgi:hypothetical protein